MKPTKMKPTKMKPTKIKPRQMKLTNKMKTKATMKMKSSLLCATLLATTTWASAATTFYDFGGTATGGSGTEVYNVLRAGTTGPGTPLKGAGKDFSDILDTAGDSTGITLNITTYRRNPINGATNTTAAGEVDGAGSIHDPVLGVNVSATGDSFAMNNQTNNNGNEFGWILTFSGLTDPAYDIRLLAGSPNVSGTWSVTTGTGDPNVLSHGTAQDDILNWTTVAPVNGEIVLTSKAIKTANYQAITMSFASLTGVPEPSFMVTKIEVTQPDSVALTFNSQPGNLYDIEANIDLGSFTSIGQIVASESSTVFTRSGVTLLNREFFRVEDLGEAPPIFSEDFETGNGGFTTEDKSTGGTGSDWQFGDPDSVGFGLNAVTTGNAGSVNCWGTNIATLGYVAPNTITCLRTPVIDLTGLSSASLTFAQALDFESGDLAEVWIIEATTSNVIAGPIHVSTDADIDRSAWAAVAPIALPPAAFAQPIRLEWRFTKVDTGTDFLGWYIDDVVVNR